MLKCFYFAFLLYKSTSSAENPLPNLVFLSEMTGFLKIACTLLIMLYYYMSWILSFCQLIITGFVFLLFYCSDSATQGA